MRRDNAPREAVPVNNRQDTSDVGMDIPSGPHLLAQVSGGPSPSSPWEFGFLFVFTFATLISHRYSSKEVILRPSCLLIAESLLPCCRPESHSGHFALNTGREGPDYPDCRLLPSSLLNSLPSFPSQTPQPPYIGSWWCQTPLQLPNTKQEREEGELATETLSLLRASKNF